MNYFLFFVVCAVAIGFVCTLECGAPNRKNRAEIKRIASTCLRSKTKRAHSEEHGSEESSDEGGFDITEDAYGNRKRHRRSDGENNENGDDDEEENTPNYQDTESDSCVVKCIFQRLDLMSPDGYPDYLKVAESFVRNAKGRELQDFLHNSTDECFRKLETAVGDRLDPCKYTAQLVKCLADKGKSTCSDWDTNEMPFVYTL